MSTGVNSYTGHYKNVSEQVPCMRGIKPKYCTHHSANHWERAKDITGSLTIHFTILKKKCVIVNPFPEKIQCFPCFWFYVSTG